MSSERHLLMAPGCVEVSDGDVFQWSDLQRELPVICLDGVYDTSLVLSISMCSFVCQQLSIV